MTKSFIDYLQDIKNTDGRNTTKELLKDCFADHGTDARAYFATAFGDVNTHIGKRRMRDIADIERNADCDTVGDEIVAADAYTLDTDISFHASLARAVDDLQASQTEADQRETIRANILRGPTPERARWKVQAILQDVTIGAGIKTINQALSDTDMDPIPNFQVMLARSHDPDALDELDYPVIAEQKRDGIRAIFRNCTFDGEPLDGWEVRSRRGNKLYGCQHIIDALDDTFHDTSRIIIDGELVADNGSFSDLQSYVRSQDDRDEDLDVNLCVFDTPMHREGAPDGVTIVDMDSRTETRQTNVGLLFRDERGDGAPIYRIESQVCETPDELRDYFTASAGTAEGEGLIIKDPTAPYKQSRSTKWKKLKHDSNEIDLRIVDWEESDNTKYAGDCGALIAEDASGTLQTKIGTGLTDEQRADIADDFESYRDMAVTVQYQDVTQAQDSDQLSLRFPRVKAIRHDTTADDASDMEVTV